MCVFTDMIKKGSDFIYPSVRVFFKDDTDKVYTFVQYFHIAPEGVTLVRMETTETGEEVRLKNVKYIKIENR